MKEMLQVEKIDELIEGAREKIEKEFRNMERLYRELYLPSSQIIASMENETSVSYEELEKLLEAGTNIPHIQMDGFLRIQKISSIIRETYHTISSFQLYNIQTIKTPKFTIHYYHRYIEVFSNAFQALYLRVFHMIGDNPLDFTDVFDLSHIASEELVRWFKEFVKGRK